MRVLKFFYSYKYFLINMGRGLWYDRRLGKPQPLCNLRSEWYDWFLQDVDSYKVKQDSIVLWSLGGAGFILKSPQSTLYIDPYCGGALKTDELTIMRMIPLPLNASDVKKIDAAVISHEDPDHLNEDFIFPICDNTACLFVGPPSVSNLLKSWGVTENRIVSLTADQEKKINDVEIIACPSNDPIPKTANTYLFKIGDISVFHAGDSLWAEEFFKLSQKYEIDIALISLGVNPPGIKYYNTPGEVLQITRDLRAKVLIPMHWDLWSFALDNPHLVEHEAKVRNMKMQVVILRIGQRFNYPMI
jgi:L-ascorbate 6-phosphate lactonase